jgi:hypothetical protein
VHRFSGKYRNQCKSEAAQRIPEFEQAAEAGMKNLQTANPDWFLLESLAYPA